MTGVQTCALPISLIQKKDADELDFSTVFYINILLSTGLYILIFIFAPVIARFYNNVSMVSMIRVLGLTIIVAGLKNVQQAYVSRNMLFKRFFYSTLGGTICAAVIGITLAYRGYGVWALIAQNLINIFVDTSILWITVKWRPKKVFSKKRFAELFSYGWKLMASSLLDTGYTNLQALIIGHKYSPADLGLYNQGNKFPNLIVNNVNTSIDSVLLPAMSSVQDEHQYVKHITRKSIMVSVYILAPFMIGLSVIAEPLIKILLTDKWLPCIPYLRVFCITYMFWPIHTANLDAIRAIGRSDLVLKLQIVKCFTGLIILFITMPHGVMAIAYGSLVDSVISQFINTWPNGKLLNYKYIDQMRDLFPAIIASVFMGGIIYPVCYLKISNVLILIIQIFMGILIYIGVSILFKVESFYYILGIIKALFSKKK